MTLKPGIRSRVLLLGILPAALMVLSLVGYFMQLRVRDTQAFFSERGQVIARQLAMAAANALVVEDRHTLQTLADSVLLENDVTAVHIFDAHSRRLVSAEIEVGPWITQTLIFTAPVISPQLKYPPPNSLETSITDSGENHFPPLLGRVEVILSRHNTAKTEREILFQSLAITCSGLLITALLAYRIGRKISVPLIELTDSVFAISRGQLDTRVHFQADRELNDLKQGFNAMAQQLSKNQEELQRQIYQATKQLQKTLRSLEERNLTLVKARTQAEAQSEIKSQFLAEISHEIRTPMNAIIGFAELLAKTELSPAQYDHIRLINQSAKNLLATLNEILDMTALESGRFNLTPKEFWVRPWLEDCLGLLIPEARHVELILSVSPNVPKILIGDPVRIRQILINLLTNALKFTKRGRIILRCQTIETGAQQAVLFSVSDSGCGISEQDQNKLFSPFLQVSHFAIDNERGTGLGLTIAKIIVDRMHGQIGVLSTPNVGSTFWVALPQTQPTPALQQPAIRFKLCLVDSSTVSRIAFAEQLRCLGCAVDCFESSDALLASAEQQKNRPDLIAICLPKALARGQLTAEMESLKANFPVPIVLIANSTQQWNASRWLEHPLVNGLWIRPSRSAYLEKMLVTISQQAVTTNSEEPPAKSPPPEVIKVLLGARNDVTRTLVRIRLEHCNADVCEAETSAEIKSLVQRKQFDLLLVDAEAPDIDVLRVIAALPKQHCPAITAALIRPNTETAKLIDAGYQKLLPQPMHDQELRELVATCRHDANGQLPTIRPEAKAYAEFMLQKTQQDADFARTMFLQLFDELPRQVDQIRQELEQEHFQRAREIAHKMHGSGSFCGLDRISLETAKLESALGNNAASPDKACLNEQLNTLQHEVKALQSLQAEILLALDET